MNEKLDFEKNKKISYAECDSLNSHLTGVLVETLENDGSVTFNMIRYSDKYSANKVDLHIINFDEKHGELFNNLLANAISEKFGLKSRDDKKITLIEKIRGFFGVS